LLEEKVGIARVGADEETLEVLMNEPAGRRAYRIC
jgi:hypothetical protein